MFGENAYPAMLGQQRGCANIGDCVHVGRDNGSALPRVGRMSKLEVAADVYFRPRLNIRLLRNKQYIVEVEFLGHDIVRKEAFVQICNHILD